MHSTFIVHAALIIYVGKTDYSVNFLKEDFKAEEDDFTLSKDNGSLIVAFPSGNCCLAALAHF